MHRCGPCPTEDGLLATVASTRILLGTGMRLQAPPNLSDDSCRVLVDAGIDDWGGVSPVTADHVNPERPWPALDRLRDVTEARGFALAPRLTVYPEWALDPDRWLDAATCIRGARPLRDAEGLGRDDPGAMFPEKMTASHDAGTGAEVVPSPPAELVDRLVLGRSGRPAGADSRTTVAPSRVHAGGAVHEVLAGVIAGEEVGHDEIVTLFSARGPEVVAVAEVGRRAAASRGRRRRSPTSRTATSTTPTSARSSAGSAGSPRVR